MIRADRADGMRPACVIATAGTTNPGGLTPDALRDLNTVIMLRLQNTGGAALSDTTIHGHHCLRAAVLHGGAQIKRMRATLPPDQLLRR